MEASSTDEQDRQATKPAADLFRQALHYFKNHDYLVAIELWERLVDSGYEDSNIQVYLHAARLERARVVERTEATLADLDRLGVPPTTHEPVGVGHYLKLAREKLANREYPEAVLALREAQLLSDEDARLDLSLARVLCLQGKLQEALMHVDRAHALSPDSPDVATTRGHVYLELGQQPDAEAAFRRALALDSHHARAWYGLASLYYVQQQLGRAEEASRRALLELPGDLAARSLFDQIRKEQENSQETIQKAEQMVAEHPTWADWHHKLGRLYAQEGRMVDSEAAFGRALELNPRYIRALLDRARLYLDSNRAPEALRDFTAAAELGASADQEGRYRARELEAGGLLDQAALELSTALGVQPDVASRHIELGKLFYRDGLLEQAARALNTGVSLCPQYPDGHHFLGLLALAEGRNEAAIDAFKAALALNPRFAEAALGLVEAQLALGRADAARITLETCVRHAVSTPAHQTRLEELVAKLGEE